MGRVASGMSRFAGVGVAFVLIVVAGGIAAQSPGAIHQWALTASASSEYGSGSQWAAMSAAGEPDVTDYGDSQFAWVPKTKDGTSDWLDSRFDQAVIPTGVSIHESFNPGFVTRVEAYHTADAAWVTLWEGSDPTPTGDIGVFSPPLTPTDVAVDRIRITIDTDVPDYNEIDAVELVGTPPGPEPSSVPSVPADTAAASLAPAPDLASLPRTPEDLRERGLEILEMQWERFGLGEFDPELPAILTEMQQRAATDLADYLAQQPPLELPGASTRRTGLVASISRVPRRSDPRLADQGGSFITALVAMLFSGADMARKLPIAADAAHFDSKPFDKQGTERVGSRDVPYSMHYEDLVGSDHGRISNSLTQRETYNIPDKVTGELQATVQDGTTVSFEMGVCPDEIGALTGRVKVNSELVFDSVSGPGYRSTYQGSDDFVVHVTDQATVGSTQHTIETHVANSGNRKAFGTEPAEVVDSDLQVIRSLAYGPDGHALDSSSQAVVTSSGVDAADMKTEGQTTVMIMVVVNQLVSAATDRWRSGDCVDVKVLQGNGGEVEAGSETQIVAQPRHKIDQADLAKPVVATFSGAAGTQPVGVAIAAPAQFTYTAGDQEGDTGTVTLTSTSNRGIGTTSVFFKVPKKESPSPPPPTPTPRPESTFEPPPTTWPSETDPAGSKRIRGTIEWHTTGRGEQVTGSVDLNLLSTNDFDFQVQPGSTYQFDTTIEYCGSAHKEGSLVPDFAGAGAGLRSGQGTILVNGGPTRNLVIWIGLLGDTFECDDPGVFGSPDGFPGCLYAGQVDATYEAESGDYVISCEGTTADPMGITATVKGTLSGDQ